MTKREVVRTVLKGGKPPYVPWNFKFTKEAGDLLCSHFGITDLEEILENHLLRLGKAIVFFTKLDYDFL